MNFMFYMSLSSSFLVITNFEGCWNNVFSHTESVCTSNVALASIEGCMRSSGLVLRTCQSSSSSRVPVTCQALLWVLAKQRLCPVKTFQVGESPCWWNGADYQSPRLGDR